MEDSVSEKGGRCLRLAETKVLLVRKGYLYTKSQQALKHLPTPTLPRPQQYLTTHGSKHTQKQAQNGSVTKSEELAEGDRDNPIPSLLLQTQHIPCSCFTLRH